MEKVCNIHDTYEVTPINEYSHNCCTQMMTMITTMPQDQLHILSWPLGHQSKKEINKIVTTIFGWKWLPARDLNNKFMTILVVVAHDGIVTTQIMVKKLYSYPLIGFDGHLWDGARPSLGPPMTGSTVKT